MKAQKITGRIILMTSVLALAFTLLLGAHAAARAAGVFGDENQATKLHEEARKLYMEAQKYLNDEEYKKAARQFEKVHDKYGDSKYAAESLYWQAFALYRLGEKSDLRDARKALERQLEQYRQADTRDDASALYYRVLGKLAELGDSDAAKLVAEHADEEFGHDEDSDTDYDQETKMEALNALLNMKSERAIPILKKVLSEKGPDTVKLREQALFLLAQHGDEESVEFLIQIARDDPNNDVRKLAVFWLSQVDSEKSIEFLEQLLRETDDQDMLERAIFAISQLSSTRSHQILQKIALDQSNSKKTREQAVFWLGQSGDSEQIEFLMGLYGKVKEESLKEKIIFSVSQNSGGKGARWLLKIVYDEDEPTDLRKNALFWAGQQGDLKLAELLKLYKDMPEIEMRKQVIFTLSQRHERKALDVMMDLAREEKNPELRKQLVFWIGQSNDPRVEDFLLDIIND